MYWGLAVGFVALLLGALAGVRAPAFFGHGGGFSLLQAEVAAVFDGAFSGEEALLVFDLDDPAGDVSFRAPLLPASGGADARWCEYHEGAEPARHTILLSEVAWMGDGENFRNEWFEVVNVSTSTVSVSEFQVIDEKGDIRFSFPFGAELGPGAFHVFVRGEDYTGTLSNQGEAVRLFDGGCALLDEVVAGPDWPAGSNKTKATMERDLGDFGWYTSALPEGTPGESNSARATAALSDEVADDPFGSTPPRATSSVVSSVKECVFDVAGLPPRSDVVISEVAWMGTVESANDEWIEVANWSEDPVDISGWQLLDQDERIRVVFDEGTVLDAGARFLLERTDDDSVPTIAADVIYTGALSNHDEGLRLFTRSCVLVDEAVARPHWPGGSVSSKGTMERRVDYTWQTSAVLGGTPRAKNTVIVVPQGVAFVTPAEVEVDGVEGSLPSDDPPPEEEAEEGSSDALILISEVLFDAAGSDKGKEFVELRNGGLSLVDLSGWRVRYTLGGGAPKNLATVGSKSEDVVVIPAGGYFLMGFNGYEAEQYGGVAADVVRSASLPNGSSEMRLFILDGDDVEVGSVTYDSASIGAAGESLEWDGAGGFVPQANPNPHGTLF
jgi:hypothetical protein